MFKSFISNLFAFVKVPDPVVLKIKEPEYIYKPTQPGLNKNVKSINKTKWIVYHNNDTSAPVALTVESINNSTTKFTGTIHYTLG